MHSNGLDETWQTDLKILRERENLSVFKGVPRFMVFRKYCKCVR